MGKKKSTDLAPVEETVLDRIRHEARQDVAVEPVEVTFEELLARLDAEGMLDSAADLGSGYHLVRGDDGKNKFVDVPFIIEDYRINPNWQFGEGVSLMIRTGVPVAFEGRPYTKFILNDGGTGIGRQIVDRHQIRGFKGQRMQGPAILCKRGLTRSDYDVMVTDPNNPNGERVKLIDPVTGNPKRGTTFYLDTSN